VFSFYIQLELKNSFSFSFILNISVGKIQQKQLQQQQNHMVQKNQLQLLGNNIGLNLMMAVAGLLNFIYFYLLSILF
jgi:hypothetical protein